MKLASLLLIMAVAFTARPAASQTAIDAKAQHRLQELASEANEEIGRFLPFIFTPIPEPGRLPEVEYYAASRTEFALAPCGDSGGPCLKIAWFDTCVDRQRFDDLAEERSLEAVRKAGKPYTKYFTVPLAQITMTPDIAEILPNAWSGSEPPMDLHGLVLRCHGAASCISVRALRGGPVGATSHPAEDDPSLTARKIGNMGLLFSPNEAHAAALRALIESVAGE